MNPTDLSFTATPDLDGWSITLRGRRPTFGYNPRTVALFVLRFMAGWT